jgi:Cysteine-rich CPCC
MAIREHSIFMENDEIPPREQKEPCPCCGCLTLDDRRRFEICSVCFWEDDGQDEL